MPSVYADDDYVMRSQRTGGSDKLAEKVPSVQSENVEEGQDVRLPKRTRKTTGRERRPTRKMSCVKLPARVQELVLIARRKTRAG